MSVRRGGALHGGPNTGSGSMDELAAAASVLAMAVDSDSDGDMDLETTVGSVTADTGSMANIESSGMENVDQQISPVDCRPEAELPKVIIRRSAPHLPPCSPPETHALAPPMSQATVAALLVRAENLFL